jgi:hypothetical protein
MNLAQHDGNIDFIEFLARAALCPEFRNGALCYRMLVRMTAIYLAFQMESSVEHMYSRKQRS